MTRFDYQFNYDLGSLGRIPTQQNNFLLDDQYENDIYEFDINGGWQRFVNFTAISHSKLLIAIVLGCRGKAKEATISAN